MIERVISGGQTGADQAGLRAAHLCGIPTGGYAPRGWLTEKGPNPNLRDFGLIECPEPSGEPFEPKWQWNAACYRARTIRNARESDITLWFEFANGADQRGFLCTQKAAWDAGKGIIVISNRASALPPVQFANNWGPSLTGTLNIAGNRESKAPGIGAWVERYLAEVFRRIISGGQT